MRSGGRPISSRQMSQASSSSLYVVAASRSAGMPRSTGQELPRPVDRLALEVVAEAPVAEHLEERVVTWRAPDLLEVVVLAGDPQAALDIDRARVGDASSAPVNTSLNWTMPLLVKSSVWSPAGTRLALGTTAWPRSAKNSRKRRRNLVGRQRPDAWVRRGGRDGHAPMVRNSLPCPEGCAVLPRQGSRMVVRYLTALAGSIASTVDE